MRVSAETVAAIGRNNPTFILKISLQVNSILLSSKRWNKRNSTPQSYGDTTEVAFEWFHTQFDFAKMMAKPYGTIVEKTRSVRLRLKIDMDKLTYARAELEHTCSFPPLTPNQLHHTSIAREGGPRTA
jgi:hypothetical protein